MLKAICLLALAAGAAHAEEAQTEMFDRNTPIQTVLDDPAFGDYGRLLFPVDTGYFSGDTLGNLRLTWYSHIDPDKTVEIVNTLRNRALNGETVFYDIYTESEKTADPDKRDTGLFFFKGTPGAKFAVCNAGGGFAYVGAMHDSFPHALELSKKSSRACLMRMAAVCIDTCAEAKLLPSSARPLTMIPLMPPADRISAFTSLYLSSENISFRSG